MAKWERLYHGGLRGLLTGDLLTKIGWYRFETGAPAGHLIWSVSHHPEKPTSVSVEEIKQFPTVDRAGIRVCLQSNARRRSRRFPGIGKALTSSLQLDQVLRTIMEKIDEFLRPDNWSLLLLDEPKQELY